MKQIKKKSLSINLLYPKIAIYLGALLSSLVLLEIIPLNLPVPIRLGLTFLIILILPGFTIVNIFLKKAGLEFFDKIINYFGFSLGFLALFVLPAYFFHWQVAILINLILISLAGLALVDVGVTIFCKNKNISKLKLVPMKVGIKELFSWKNIRFALIIIFTIGFAFLIYKTKTIIGNDSQVHLAFIKRMLENGISSQNPFFKEFGDLPFYGHAIWQPIVAVISKLSNINHVKIWHWLPIFLAPLILFSAYFFAKNLFKSKNAAFITTAVIFYFLGFVAFIDTGGRDLRMLVYPLNIALYLLLPLFFGWFFKFLKENKRWILVILGLIAFLIIATHMFYFVLLNLGLGAFLILYLIIHRKKNLKETKKIALAWGVVILIAIPYYILQLKGGMVGEDILNAHYQTSINRGNLIQFWGNLLIIKPFFLYPGRINWGVFSFLAPLTYLILTPLLFIWFHKKKWAIFLIALMLVTPLICLNPLAVKILGDTIGFPKVARIYQIAPIYYIASFFIYLAISTLKIKLNKERFLKIIIPTVLIVIVTLLVPWKIFWNNVETASSGKKQHIYLNNQTVDFLNSTEKDSVFAASSKLAKNITMFSSSYVVCIDNFHGFWGYKIINARKNNNDQILDPKVEIKKTIPLLDKYNVNYILLPFSETTKFDNQKRFQKVYNDSQYQVYQYQEKI